MGASQLLAESPNEADRRLDEGLYHYSDYCGRQMTSHSAFVGAGIVGGTIVILLAPAISVALSIIILVGLVWQFGRFEFWEAQGALAQKLATSAGVEHLEVKIARETLINSPGDMSVLLANEVIEAAHEKSWIVRHWTGFHMYIVRIGLFSRYLIQRRWRTSVREGQSISSVIGQDEAVWKQLTAYWEEREEQETKPTLQEAKPTTS